MTSDRRYMALALSLGARGLGRVWPRPSVGCVIVKDGRIIGRGWTQGQSGPHGEAMALAQAGEAARGATAYVTLEPCAHHGRTPPCSEALVRAGVARVVSALEDPDPRVAGKGHAILRAAGIAVDTGLMAAEALASHEGFLKRIGQGRPMLTLKLATSFDGRIATASGESQWITGPEARRLVHLQRATHDAVLIGGGTARDDDPSLTVRGLGIAEQPVRVALSRRLDLPLDGTLARTARDIPVWLVHGPDAPEARREAFAATGAVLIEAALGEGRQLGPAAVMEALGGAGLTRVYCEGGGMLAASFLQAGLADRLIGFTAGLALGAEGRPSLGAMELAHLADAPRFDLIESRPVGPDVMHLWRRRPA
ncbi:bifunctional diaminohydroxyphosphoribosylaminopyrimidine deaminase/5-amino-6-(5-phosphoribosylamino)uracil reductase RibD [Mangrovicoccus sp. HB161399]|uniref:bifunctional diaminohydroxyphosphoribosylaminopyrimidine deaminase/5-amino-6-(5-phosphoribosylamino)uracil reductase RibD n=1 Tax=Mangrovicoccus sp. HB161399 TaxID=2720392 RepID=UPI001553A3C0|nr:bifunctional diaminohydroxyphosphoribosylaminopyrimidine deaminase/5-amino-6-(5-phosphoribosylamino)uracil reductase RibD [Mangrovicoccus sp. HB161399]